MERKKSTLAYQSLCHVLPGGVNSPVRACKSVQQIPLVASHANADQIYDVDGNAYIDLCGSWGALIHGHAHPKIVHASQKRIAQGSTFGATTEIERDLAQKIMSHMKSIEKIRFVSSGTEATMSAIRLARGYTGRDLVIKFSGNYHGHADFFLIKAGSGVFHLTESSSAGIPHTVVQHTLSLKYNDITQFKEAISNRVAAVIVEPISGNMGVVPASIDFIHVLREETEKVGALLIFDEVITGFRIGLGGAQDYYNVTPDLTCLGKIIGGGFPAAAFGGRNEIMAWLAPNGPVYQAGTLSGNPVAMEAGLQSLQLVSEKGFYAELKRKTDIITEPIREALKGRQACVQQVGSMFTLFFGKTEVHNHEDAQQLDNELFGRFFRFLFERGVYFPPAQQEAAFVSMAHRDEHLETVRDLCLEFLHTIKG